MTPCEIVSLLTARGQTLGCAESLTGGLLSDAIVQVPGASRVMMGGIVAYDEGRKQTLLGVSADSLQRFTAVSAQVASEMAQGAQRALAVDYALSTTGYAGPDGAEVGLVYVGVATPQGVHTREHRFAGDRAQIRRQAVQAALALLAEKL